MRVGEGGGAGLLFKYNVLLESGNYKFDNQYMYKRLIGK